MNLDNGSKARFRYEKVLGRSVEFVKSWVFSEVLKCKFSLKRVSGSAEVFWLLGEFVKIWFLRIGTLPLFLGRSYLQFSQKLKDRIIFPKFFFGNHTFSLQVLNQKVWQWAYFLLKFCQTFLQSWFHT